MLAYSQNLYSYLMPTNLKACQKDVDKICALVRPGEGRIQNCLMDNKTILSRPCMAAQRAIANNYEKRFAFIMSDCKKEELNFCSHLRRYAFRVTNCLKSEFSKNKKAFSANCSKGFTKHFNFVPSVMP